jgi:biotin carboxyl carrier protein
MEFEIEFDGKKFKIKIIKTAEGTKIKINEKEFIFTEKEKPNKIFTPQFLISKKETLEKEKILAPIPGELGEVFVKEGEKIKKGQKLLTIFAMKTENEILAPREGIIEKIFVKKGEKVQKDQELLEIK